jgi:hypothetical protein
MAQGRRPADFSAHQRISFSQLIFPPAPPFPPPQNTSTIRLTSHTNDGRSLEEHGGEGSAEGCGGHSGRLENGHVEARYREHVASWHLLHADGQAWGQVVLAVHALMQPSLVQAPTAWGSSTSSLPRCRGLNVI